MLNDTIAAIATSVSNSGISIVRVSGKDAVSIVDSVFVNSKQQHTLSSKESHTISYGFLLDGDNVIDEVLVSVFNAPRSYTSEDTVEINCHGGIFVTNRVLETVIKAGARLAMPGEFTKRAFLNGRIDLSEAEAVMDVISSDSSASLKAGISQLKGSVYSSVKKIRDSLIYEVAFIESALDDPEHISLDGFSERLLTKIKDISEEIHKLIDSCDTGRILKNGIRTVIVGKPNAGKSSLLNTLSGFERAIVTDIAGTTRDTIEEKISIGDINLVLVDTAGIRNTDDSIEKIGVDLALKSIDDADLILYVVDSSSPLDESDEKIIELIRSRKSIILLNKSDLKSVISVEEIKSMIPDANIIVTSIIENDGIDRLTDTIKDMFIRNGIENNNEVIITGLRHKEKLVESLHSLKSVIESIEMSLPEDFLTIDLMNAYTSLGNIIGEEVSDDLINEIFGKFCMGK